ncbi:MAG: MFS transporter [Myxococcota bacterium]|nr:MFS transporter [Myxococcota bacterium]
MANAPRLFTRPFVLLVAGHFLQALGWSSMLVLPVYLGGLGASHTEIGSVMAAASVGGLCFRPAVGWAIDRVGRKPTLIFGTLILAVGMGLISLVDAVGPLIYLSRVLIGIGAGALFTAYFVFVSDFIPPSRRTEGIALFGISGLLPVALNGVSDDLAQLFGEGTSGLKFLFPILAIIVLLSIVFVIFVPEQRRAPSTVARTGSFRGVMRTIGHVQLRPVWVATMIFSTLVAVFMAFVTITAQQRNIESASDLWVAYAGGAVGVRILGAKLPDLVGTSNLVVPAIAAYIAGCLGVAHCSNYGELMLAGAASGLGHGYCFPVLTSQVMTRTPLVYRGSAMAFFTAIWEACALIMTPLMGMLADKKGLELMFASLAIGTMICLIIWVWLEHRTIAKTRDLALHDAN